jgi:hypothetical protein
MGHDYVNRFDLSAMGLFAGIRAEIPTLEWFDLVRTGAYDEAFAHRRLFLEMRPYGG